MVISAANMALVAVVALLYAYNTLSVVETCLGFLLVLAIAVFLWFYRRGSSRRSNSSRIHRAIWIGFILGLLWVVEISINNFIAPPLPARDIIDNVFWAAIALAIFIFASICAYQTDSIVRGIEAGAWSGLASGSVACGMALSVIVFGMRYVTQDPLNVVEWAERASASIAPSMAAYFAFETFAGAFGHLVVLGIVMGGLLGMMGGAMGKGTQRTARWIRKARSIR